MSTTVRSVRASEKAIIMWLGHSAFLIKSPLGKNILIDPWLENPKAPAGAKDIAPVDLILVSHGHSDHFGNAVEVAKRTGAPVVCIHEISLYLHRQGIASAQGMNKGGTREVKGVKVTMTDARHSSGIDMNGTVLNGGEAAGYVIELENGYKVYHAGDTSLFGDMEYIGKLYKPDVAILPIGDLFTMGPKEAAVAATLLEPNVIIGMHYGTFPALTGTPEELMKHLPAKLKNRVRVLSPGVPEVLAGD